jgi:phosphate uptake regulator
MTDAEYEERLGKLMDGLGRDHPALTNQEFLELMKEALVIRKQQLAKAIAARDQVIAFVRDVTEQIKATETLLRSQLGMSDSEDLGTKVNIPAELRFVGMTIPEAAATVLAEVGQPMRAAEIWERMKGGGMTIASSRPVTTVVASLSRHPDMFERTGPNTFATKSTELSH